jgi:hypothetical protein
MECVNHDKESIDWEDGFAGTGSDRLVGER